MARLVYFGFAASNVSLRYERPYAEIAQPGKFDSNGVAYRGFDTDSDADLISALRMRIKREERTGAFTVRELPGQPSNELLEQLRIRTSITRPMISRATGDNLKSAIQQHNEVLAWFVRECLKGKAQAA